MHASEILGATTNCRVSIVGWHAGFMNPALRPYVRDAWHMLLMMMMMIGCAATHTTRATLDQICYTRTSSPISHSTDPSPLHFHLCRLWTRKCFLILYEDICPCPLFLGGWGGGATVHISQDTVVDLRIVTSNFF